jgi:hypothetical protein
MVAHAAPIGRPAQARLLGDGPYADVEVMAPTVGLRDEINPTRIILTLAAATTATAAPSITPSPASAPGRRF